MRSEKEYGTESNSTETSRLKREASESWWEHAANNAKRNQTHSSFVLISFQYTDSHTR